MNVFESKVVKLINQISRKDNILIHCKRNVQNRFCTQYVDIILDCGSSNYYLAIECKRVRTNIFYFSRYFHSKQIILISEYLENSGRAGFIALEFKKNICLIPWSLLIGHVLEGYTFFSDQTVLTHAINMSLHLKYILKLNNEYYYK